MNYLKAALPSLVALGFVWGIFNWWTLEFKAFTSYAYVRESAPPLPQETPALILTNQSGNRIELKELKDQFHLMTFGFLDCTGTCPISMAEFNEINQSLVDQGIGNLKLLTITLDPTRDQQKHLFAMWKSFGEPKNWAIARPEIESLDSYWAILNKMGMWVDADEFGTPIHDDRSFLINPQGLIVKSFAGVPPAATLIAEMGLP